MWKVARNMERFTLQFSAAPCGILETPKFFPQAYFNHKTTHAHLALLTGSCIHVIYQRCNLHTHWDPDLFLNGRSCLFSPKLCVFGPRRLNGPEFLLHLRSAFSEAHLQAI